MGYDDGEGWKLGCYGHMLEPDEAKILAGLKARCLIHHPQADHVLEVTFQEATPDGDFVKISQGGGIFGGGYMWVLTPDVRILCKFPPPPKEKPKLKSKSGGWPHFTDHQPEDFSP